MSRESRQGSQASLRESALDETEEACGAVRRLRHTVAERSESAKAAAPRVVRH